MYAISFAQFFYSIPSNFVIKFILLLVISVILKHPNGDFWYLQKLGISFSGPPFLSRY